MFILRNVELRDLDDLYSLSGNATFINLPHDKKLIEEKIKSSLIAFNNPNKDLSKNYYIFVIQDVSKNKVIGCSMIHAQHGNDKEPHFFLRVSHEHKYSQTINTGFVHGTLKLGLDTNGPSEIGGLVLDPEYRGIGSKLGKQISFVRFLYMSLRPERFKSEILSELMPPFDAEGNSPLWEAIGRRFLNMQYDVADKLSRSNKEFILSLFPAENIYMTLLPMEARNSIGVVGSDTQPVKHMLEKVGFEYTSEVDPFDGGPHYKCRLKNITPIRNSMSGLLNRKVDFDSNKSIDVLLSYENVEQEFSAIRAEVNFLNNEFVLQDDLITLLDLVGGDKLQAIPF